MDVNSYFPSAQELELYVDWQEKGLLWNYVFELRQATWNGFAEIEAKKGIVKPKVPLSTPYGQEVLRIIMFRVLEEAAESLMAKDSVHVKEELIDAMNYLLSIFLLDSDERKLKGIYQLFTDITGDIPWGEPLTLEDLGQMTLYFGGSLADKLRNRSWMNHAQDFYFAGWGLLEEVTLNIAFLLMKPFDSLEDFMKFFVAKDKVLQFRLETKY